MMLRRRGSSGSGYLLWARGGAMRMVLLAREIRRGLYEQGF